MASQLQPRPTTKRSRSDLSRSSTPAPAETDTEDLKSSLPPFLRQAPDEISRKFEYIQELESARRDSFISDPEPDPDHPWAQELTIETARRNRYTDIIPWKQSRIHLRVSPGTPDYINASPISLPRSDGSHELQYIATQGPKQTGVNHFWQMVWHECGEVAVVVMLTKLTEGTREKCFRYFPSAGDPAPRPAGSTPSMQNAGTPRAGTPSVGSPSAGTLNPQPQAQSSSTPRSSNANLSTATQPSVPLQLTSENGQAVEGSVTLIDTHWDEASQAAIRKLCLVRGDESRIVYHLLFAGWPDFGVPHGRDRAALLRLIRLSDEKNDGEQEKSPRIVHCSAGVGRTGTFIALEHLLGELDHGSFDDPKSLQAHSTELKPEDDPDEEMHTWPDPVFNTVATLREQRPVMVQGLPQYHFIYEILAEECLKRKKRLLEEKKAMAEPSPKALRLGKGLKKMLHLGRHASMGKNGKTNDQVVSASKTLVGALPSAFMRWALMGGIAGSIAMYIMFRWA